MYFRRFFRWRTTLLLGAVLLFVAVFLLTKEVRHGYRVAYAQTKAARIPIFITLTHRATSVARPDKIIEYTMYHAARSDGATMDGQMMPRPDRQRYLVRSIRFPAKGMLVDVADDVKATSTYFLADTSPTRWGLHEFDPARQCAEIRDGEGKLAAGAEKVDGMDSVLGFRAVHVVWGDSENHADEWRAVDFNCEMLKKHIEFKDSAGNIAGVTDTVATAIAPGDPPAHLFDLPADFSEQSPSKLDMSFAARFTKGIVAEYLRRSQPQRESRYDKYNPAGRPPAVEARK